MRKNLFTLLSLVILASMLLAACAPTAAPERIVETVEVVLTQIVEIAGTAMVVTATPEPEPSGEPLKAVSPEFKNADTFMVIDGAGEQETLDPAWTYETRGSGIEANIYEGMVWFNREKTDEFIPALATEWSASDDGLEWVFTIRQGVTFHEGGTLEPHDVAYTLWRSMLQGRIDGPTWIAYEGFFGSPMAMASSKDFAAAVQGTETFEELTPDQLADVCEQVKSKVVPDDAAGTVTFKLAQPMPWMLATTASNIMGAYLDQEWMAEQGDWDGDCATWQNFADPAAEDTILFDRANGTGPYKLDYWTPGEETVLVANENYWRTEPMWEGGPSGVARIPRVVFKDITEWGTRLSMLEAGDADWIYTPASFRSQLYPYAKETCSFDGKCEETNPNGYLQIWSKLPQPEMTPAQLNWQINTEGGNPFIGSGGLDGNGIPPNMFQDIHVRKAFNYCFNFQAMIDEALVGEGIQAQGPIIAGMMGYREGEAPLYSYDPAKCEEEFKLADLNGNGIPAGEDPDDIWDKGFYMQIAYNQGNDVRRLASEILKAGIEAVNPGFSVQVLAMPWPVLLESRRSGKLPIYVGGWVEDFHDPHNWAQPFLFSAGNYGRVINMTDDYKAKYDQWILEAVKETDQEKRRAIYEQIQLASQEDAVVIWMYQVNWFDPFQL
ncbi:MAG TPA: ABC transporter substrate-binding protein, partial [Anaerolineales bacterium]